MRKKSNQNWLSSKITLHTTIFMLLISLVSILIVFYWSFYHFSNIFEDRVIDHYTFQQNESLGIENEWILGVTTDSIDVVEAIHGETVADVIWESSQSQTEVEELYKEKIDNKELMYIINLDSANGETIYKYSIIKNIYAEIFPYILISFFLLFLVILAITKIYTKNISNQLYQNIDLLSSYIKETGAGNEMPLDSLDIYDKDIYNLGLTYRQMHDELKEQDQLQQSMLQYISHEMKTPIMIIESYTTSAEDEIYPKGDLPSTLTTILTQTERMKKKVQDLLTVVKINSSTQVAMVPESLKLANIIRSITQNMYVQGDKQLELQLECEGTIIGVKEKINILIENLFENQLKYSEQTMYIRLYEQDDTISLLFYNDGSSIQDDLKEIIFEPFTKGYNGTNGLGLSICKTIALQHHGNIQIVDSDEGTLFAVTFPKAK